MRRLLLVLLLFACGAPDEEGHVDDVEIRYDHFLGTFDYGQTPPELVGDPRLERIRPVSVDKTLSVLATGGLALAEGVHKPNRYGARGGSSQGYCTSDPASWSNYCYVAYSRWARIKFDAASCSGVNANIVGAMLAGLNRFKSEATLNWGWDVANAAASEDDFTTLKCMPWSDPVGDADVNVWFCWDLAPLGYPHDICFLKPGTHAARVGAAAIQASYGTGFAGQTFANNMAMHELMHSLGVGHFSSGDPFNSIMWPYMTTNFLQQTNSTQVSMMRNYLHRIGPFHVARCNWLPADPIGEACPNKADVPYETL